MRRIDTLNRHLLPSATLGSEAWVQPSLAPPKQTFGNSVDAKVELPEPQYTFVPRFNLETQTDAMLQYLAEHGYVAVQNVLSTQECQEGVQLMWDFLEGLGRGVDRKDPSTWDNNKWYPAGIMDTGIIARFGIGQSPFQWYIRGKERVKSVYEKVHGTKDLLVSFDGGCVFRPWSVNRKWRTSGAWFHTDQSPYPKAGYEAAVGFDREYIQGFVNLVRTSPATGGNIVVPQSHKCFEEFAKRYWDPEREIIRYDLMATEDPSLFASITPHLEAGDMFLWDSRTMHANTPGKVDAMEDSQLEHPDLIRVASYVCMSPREQASPEVLQQRQEAVRKGHTFGHQASHKNDPLARHAPQDGVQFSGIASLNDYQKGLV